MQKLAIQRTSCVDTAILVLLSESRLGIFLAQVTSLMPKGFMEHQSWDRCLYFVERATQSRCREHQQAGGFGEKLNPYQGQELKYIGVELIYYLRLRRTNSYSDS